MSRKDPNDDMIGFKDFLDSEDKTKPIGNKRVDNLNYEIISFLEKDAKRLDKHISLFEEKTFMIKNFPQDSQIIVELETSIIEKRIAIINHTKNNPSAIIANLSEVLEDHFSSL